MLVLAHAQAWLARTEREQRAVEEGRHVDNVWVIVFRLNKEAPDLLPVRLTLLYYDQAMPYFTYDQCRTLLMAGRDGARAESLLLSTTRPTGLSLEYN